MKKTLGNTLKKVEKNGGIAGSASSDAAAAADEGGETPAKKKATPRKRKATAEDGGATAAADGVTPKKRGRKPKVKKEDTPVEGKFLTPYQPAYREKDSFFANDLCFLFVDDGAVGDEEVKAEDVEEEDDEKL